MTSQWIQGLIIAAAVAWSLLHLLRKYFPRQIAHVRDRCGAVMRKPSQPRLLQRMGAWMQVREVNDEGCGSGCGGCSGCPSNPQPGKQEHALSFHRRS
jgi:hypothetical protein